MLAVLSVSPTAAKPSQGCSARAATEARRRNHSSRHVCGSTSYDSSKSPFREGSFVVSVHPVSGQHVGPAEGDKIDEFGANGSGRQSYTTSGRKTLVIVAQCPWKLTVLRTTA